MGCLNSDHRKEWWSEAVKREVHSIPFCKVQTASWEHVSKTEASQNKNKTWWSTLDAFLDPKQNPTTLKNKQNQNKQTNLQNILQKFWWNPFWPGMGFPLFQSWIWWCNQRSILSVAKDCYLHWSLQTTNLGGDLKGHIFSQWNTLGSK